ncbi:nuclear transport factor 2 family protein [Salinibius halmophilus]|uniref:nuclear transport factor 2 family protein n=1 Tax=Salinibius halmophilus TaxID=1853216 RepID=UPI000E6620FC|nr:nuclear transport factor 2 family protein [Salinibius halmophilus]
MADIILSLFKPFEQQWLERSLAPQFLHPNFTGISDTGLRYGRADYQCASQPAERTLVLECMAWHQLSDELVQLSYQSAWQGENGSFWQRAQRSSIWQCCKSSWQLRFHQATPLSGTHCA